jgi:subtilisin family serine protease
MNASEPIYRLPPDWEMQRVSTPLSEVHDWSLEFLGIPELWKQGRAEGLKICILDTGVDTTHPDLVGCIAEAKDFTGSMWGPMDRVGHGTWCAGMIGARAGNNVGVAGITQAKLLIGKVLGDNGSGSDRGIEAGIRWAIDMDADILSLSLGGPRMSERLHRAFIDFVNRPRRFAFAAAGNDGPGSRPNFPGAWSETISVAAVDKQGHVTSFSSRGETVDIAAPGFEMLSTVPGGYGTMSGTSMACPVAAAVGSLALSKHNRTGGQSPLNTVAEMRDHLQRTAIDKGAPGRDDEYGFGLIDPAALLASVDAPTAPSPIPTPPPDNPGGVPGVWVFVPGGTTFQG